MMKTVKSAAGKLGNKTLVALIILALFLLFLLQNTTLVDIRFLFWRITMSRVILLLGSLAAGCLIGLLLGWEIFGRKHKSGQ